MDHYNGDQYTLIGFVCGVLGGLGKFLLQIHQPFAINLVQAVFTALLCGAAGVAGKEAWLWLKRKYLGKKKTR